MKQVNGKVMSASIPNFQIFALSYNCLSVSYNYQKLFYRARIAELVNGEL